MLVEVTTNDNSHRLNLAKYSLRSQERPRKWSFLTPFSYIGPNTLYDFMAKGLPMYVRMVFIFQSLIL